MKRPVEQLLAGLKRGLAPVYLITGDEPLQRIEGADALRAAARAAGYEERVVLDAESGTDWSALRLEADSLSLFSARRLIEIRLREARLGAEGAEALREYCCAPPADVLLLLSAPRFDSRTQQSAWYKAVGAAGVIVRVWPIKAAEMPEWIADRLAQRGLGATAEAIGVLAERAEGNLPAAAQDIEKLALLAAGRTLNAADVLAAVGDSARFDLFALADTALAGDTARALRMLRGLREEGAEPVLICWSLTRELRAAALLAAGAAPEAAMPGYRLYPPRDGLLRAAAQRLGGRNLRKLLRHAIGIDQVLKIAATRDPWVELTGLCLLIARTPSGGWAWTH